MLPLDEGAFLPLLQWLVAQYDIQHDPIVDSIDGYWADFTLDGVQGCLTIDAWMFSIAVNDDKLRDDLLARLQASPFGR